MPKMPSQGSKVEMITAAVAMGSIGGLVGLTVTGVLAKLPPWAAVLIVVVELFLPLLVYFILKRADERR